MNGKRFGLGVTLTLAVGMAFGQGAQGIRDALAAKAEQAGKANALAVAGTDGWLFFVPELRYLTAGEFWGPNAAKVSHATSAAAADPLPAILDFKAQCAKAGVDLLIVPVPAKAAIYSDMLVGGKAPNSSTRIDSAQAAFLAKLTASGIKTLDLTPIFQTYRKNHPSDLLYAKTDTHWSGNGIAVAADAIAAQIKGQPWYKGVAKSKFTPTLKTITVSTGDLAGMISGAKPGPEKIRLTVVKKGSASVASDRKSPLVLLGDSHNLIFSTGGDMLAENAGFPENLALRIGFAPDVVAVMGSGATPARINLARRGDNLAGKKMIVWVFSSREFTEGQGWRKVPVVR
ncbi:alginate O-acetyltransferase AlgX-related protein [Fimbriimonas ginsengisoli]|nr:hypothetical protein [Fimbriimonas ginsengisoli]